MKNLIKIAGALFLAILLPLTAQAKPILIATTDDGSKKLMTKSDSPLSPEVIETARKVYRCAKKQGLYDKNIFTFIDMSMPSSQKRLWIVDLDQMKILYNGLVAHGKNSGSLIPTKFSDQPQSLETSLGLYKTDSPYYGKNGISLKLSGLEPGFNDKAMQRHIVMHGAPYVSEDFVKRYGRLGRSWGCPAISQKAIKPVINKIKGGSLMFIYADNADYLKNSKFVNCK